RPVGQTLRCLQPLISMREPGGVLTIGGPITGRPLYGIHHAEQPSVLRQPTLQQAPLPKQCLMHWFDGPLTRLLREISGEQALFDKKIDKRAALSRDFREARNAATRRSCVRIDSC